MTPLVNGINYSYVNITLILFGRPIFGITAIDYKRKQDKKNNPGNGKAPVSRGYGLEEYECSITFSTDEWKRIIAQAPNRNPLEIGPFDVTIAFSGPGVPFTKDKLKAAEFLEDPFSGKSGDTYLPAVVPMIIGGIER